ncbi:MAG TPA: hypothetical protein VIO16_14170 [Dehalococcoidia bacterium]
MSPIYSGEIETAPEGQDISSLGHTSWGAMLGNEVKRTFGESPIAKLVGMSELSAANGVPPEIGGLEGAALGPSPDEYRKIFTDTPEIGTAEAKARVKAAGLDSVVHLPDAPTMKSGALDIMLQRARTDQERSAKIAEGPSGLISGAFDKGTSLLVSAVDPLNIAVGMIPIMGEARYGQLLASAGSNVVARAGVRAGVGAAQGAMFSTAMTPVDWLANTQEGRDYGMSEALHSILYGAGTFGLMHVAGGGGADLYRAARGRPLYPFAPGELKGQEIASNADLAHGVADVTRPSAGDGVQALSPTNEVTVRDVVGEAPDRLAAGLPPRAMEDLMQTSLAQLKRGEPVKAADVLEAAARIDLDIAQALEPERIRGATIEHEGKIYEAANHADAIAKLETERGVRLDDISDQTVSAGFVTTKGRVVDREEALGIARREEQHSPDSASRPSR